MNLQKMNLHVISNSIRLFFVAPHSDRSSQSLRITLSVSAFSSAIVQGVFLFVALRSKKKKNSLEYTTFSELDFRGFRMGPKRLAG